MEDDDVPVLLEHKSVLSKQCEQSAHRVPCTLITGFLGAGKSTLLKWILTERHGYRIAVIMNEFGDTADIEAKAINITSDDNDTGGLSEEFLELPNGCLCCSIKDSGLAAIENLMRRKGAFDYILLETTGFADPGPIASSFWHNEEFTEGLGRHMYLDGVVCVVDAVFGGKNIDGNDGDLSIRQIASADTILLNKVDLVTEGAVAKLEARLQKINAAAPIYRTIQGQVDLKYVIGLGAYAAKLPSFPSLDHNCDDGDDHDHTHGRPATTHESITSMQVTCPTLTPNQAQRLDEWIRMALWEGSLLDMDASPSAPRVEILRCKGIYALNNGEHFVLQGVRSMYEITPLKSTGSELGVPEQGKLVFIGRGLDEAARKSLLRVIHIYVSDD